MGDPRRLDYRCHRPSRAYGSPMNRLLQEARHAVPGRPGSPLRFS